MKKNSYFLKNIPNSSLLLLAQVIFGADPSRYHFQIFLQYPLFFDILLDLETVSL